MTYSLSSAENGEQIIQPLADKMRVMRQRYERTKRYRHIDFWTQCLNRVPKQAPSSAQICWYVALVEAPRPTMLARSRWDEFVCSQAS